jgi:cephalosporin hydroxylase
MNLYKNFLENEENSMCKWEQYFPVYERYFSQFRHKTITFVEIGVASGGSLLMWRKFLGPHAKIVGIDIRKMCEKYDDPKNNIFVRIGSQSDLNFLQKLVDEFGDFDVILDDGSHQMNDIKASFDFLYNKLNKNGIYLIEDLHTAYWERYGVGVNSQDNFINFCKESVDKLNAKYSHGQIESDFVANNTLGIHFYDSIVVFERGCVKSRAKRTCDPKPMISSMR